MALSNTSDVQEPATAFGATKDAIDTLVEERIGAEDSNQNESCGNTATTDECSSHTISSRTTSISSDVSISGVTPLRAVRTFSSASPRTVSPAASDEDSCISSNAGEESTITSSTTFSTGRTPSSSSRPTDLDNAPIASAGGERHSFNAVVVTTTGIEGKPQSTHNLMEYIDTTSGGRPSRRSRDCGSSVSSLPLSPVRPKGMEERMRKRLSERNLTTTKPCNGKDSTSNSPPDTRTTGRHTENHGKSGDSSTSAELRRSTGNLDFRLDSEKGGMKCGGSIQSLRGKRSSFSSQRRHASMRNLGSASETITRPSRRPRRQSSESSLSAQGGPRMQTTPPGEKPAVAPPSDSSHPKSYEEALETNRTLQRQIEEQAEQLQEKEHQIQKLLLTQPELGIGVVKEEEEEEDDGSSGADKETMRAELKQMKSTMSRLLKDNEEAEAGWKRRLEQAQMSANTMSTVLSEANERISVLENQVRDYEHRDLNGGQEDLDEIRDQRDELLSKVDQLEREREEAEVSWKRELENVRKESVAKESALEKAQHRIKVLEKRGREGKAPLPPPRTVDADDGKISSDSMRSHDSARSLSSVKIDRQARESYLRQAFSPRKSGRDFQDTVGLIQEAALPSSGFEEEKEENSKVVEGTREKLKLTRRGSNSSGGSKAGQDKLDRKVKTLQNECHVLRSALQAKQAEAEDLSSTLKEKEAETEALRQSVAQLQESEWSIRQDMVKYKDEFEVVLEESLTDKEKLKSLQQVNQTLRSQVDELDRQLRVLREELDDTRERERQWKEAQWDRKVKELQSEEAYQITIDREDAVDEKKMSNLSAASQAAFLEAAMTRKRLSSSSALTTSNQRGWGITRLFVNPSIDQTCHDVVPDDVVRLAEENSKLKSELVKLNAQYKEESYVNQKKLVELQQHLARVAAE